MGIAIFYLVLYGTANVNILLRILNIPEATAFVYACIGLRIYRDILSSATYVLPYISFSVHAVRPPLQWHSFSTFLC